MSKKKNSMSLTASTAAALDPEQELAEEVRVTVARPRPEITDDAGYAAAVEAAKAVKALQKDVKAFFEPLRKAAKATYDGVLARRAAMTGPLEEAEKDLKGRMSAYALEKERQRREAETAMRRAAAEEADRKLEAAAAAETAGDAAAAEYGLSEAEVLEGLALTGTVAGNAPRARGAGLTRTWKITAVDPALVPTTLNGVELRPVDTAAVMRLIRATRGQVQIPGITFTEDVTVSIRT